MYINDVLDSIDLIISYSSKIHLPSLRRNTILSDAITKRLEIIGEAMKNLSPLFSKDYPEILWNEFISGRNFLSHVYYAVSISKLTSIIENDLPVLKKQMLTIKKEIEK